MGYDPKLPASSSIFLPLMLSVLATASLTKPVRGFSSSRLTWTCPKIREEPTSLGQYLAHLSLPVGHGWCIFREQTPVALSAQDNKVLIRVFNLSSLY